MWSRSWPPATGYRPHELLVRRSSWTRPSHRPGAGRLPDRRDPVSTTPPALSADLETGLRRLKLASMRRLAAELLVTAKTQRSTPEEFLRTLIEAEIAARDQSNTRTRRRLAGFPVTKTLDEFQVAASPSRRPRSTTWPASNGSRPPKTYA